MGGEHKCPLCPATFTRPQHVGRHLRAHTGDRPYGCKECPLRFARSDLLSRHVNKTHRPPDESAAAKDSKKDRRKSMGSHTDGQPILKSQDKVRAASFSLAPQSIRPAPPQTAMPAPPIQRTAGYAARTMGQNFSVAGPSNSSTMSGSRLPRPDFSNPFAASSSATSQSGGMNPSQMASVPMQVVQSDQGPSTQRMPVVWNGMPAYDLGLKKRACDQCNTSKVRCDFADPCLRCSTKKFPCSYNKPQKSRSVILPVLPFVPGRSPVSGYPPPALTQLTTSLSPDSNFSSPYSSVSPNIPHLTPAATSAFVPLQQPQEMRRYSTNTQPPHLPVYRHSLPGDMYEGQIQVDQSWPPAEPYIPARNPSADMAYSASGLAAQPPYYAAQTDYGHALYLQHTEPQQGSWRQMPLPNAHFMPTLPQQQLGMAQRSDTTTSPVALAPTPALTSHATSPSGRSGPDEPLEHGRAMSGGSVSIGQMRTEPLIAMTDVQADSTKMSFGTPPGSMLPPAIPGTQLDAGIYQSSYSDAVGNMVFLPPSPAPHGPASASAPEAPLDQMYQFRTTIQPFMRDEDDTTASQADSSANLTSFLDIDEATYQQHLEHRRRASMNGGIWAAAFNNMTLHDSAGNPLPLASAGLAPQVFPQQADGGAGLKRPSMQTTPATIADAAGRMPSMSDVKDLWKLFMTDPLTGATPSKENTAFLDFGQAQPLATPRPGIGQRTLSKSNSMPDLKSPPLGGQAFFSGLYGNNRGSADQTTAVTQQAGMGQVTTQPAGPEATSGADDGEGQPLKDWKKEMKQRQASFNMNIQHPGQRGTKTSPSGSKSPAATAEVNTEFPFGQGLLPPPPPQTQYPAYSLPAHPSAAADTQAQYANRPMASVFQRNQALDQTLAPERAPSFGINGPIFDTVTGGTASIPVYPRMAQPPLSYIPQHAARQVPVYTQAYTPTFQPYQSGGKLTSASARPGNKRLASQTLVGADGKKASFSLFDAEEEGDEEEGAEVDTAFGALGSAALSLPVGWQSANA